MMAELCARNALVLPPRASSVSLPEGSAALRVFVIYDGGSGNGMMAALLAATASSPCVQLTQDEAELHTASRVLLLLSPGVLGAGKRALGQLEEVLGRDAHRERLAAVFSEQAGWCFGCAEQKAAPVAVQDALSELEALSYRPKSTGRSRHEFSVMMAQLLKVLTNGAASDHAEPEPENPN